MTQTTKVRRFLRELDRCLEVKEILDALADKTWPGCKCPECNVARYIKTLEVR